TDEATIIRESPLRSALKGFTWRIIATTTTIVIALIVTGDIKPALKIGAVEFVAKFAVYYLHERAWARAPLGSVRRLLRGKSDDSKG
ncbi:MAG: putative membrane protein, partial [Limisphaerales bacterium]